MHKAFPCSLLREIPFRVQPTPPHPTRAIRASGFGRPRFAPSRRHPLAPEAAQSRNRRRHQSGLSLEAPWQPAPRSRSSVRCPREQQAATTTTFKFTSGPPQVCLRMQVCPKVRHGCALGRRNPRTPCVRAGGRKAGRRTCAPAHRAQPPCTAGPGPAQPPAVAVREGARCISWHHRGRRCRRAGGGAGFRV